MEDTTTDCYTILGDYKLLGSAFKPNDNKDTESTKPNKFILAALEQYYERKDKFGFIDKQKLEVLRNQISSLQGSQTLKSVYYSQYAICLENLRKFFKECATDKQKAKAAITKVLSQVKAIGGDFTDESVTAFRALYCLFFFHQYFSSDDKLENDFVQLVEIMSIFLGNARNTAHKFEPIVFIAFNCFLSKQIEETRGRPSKKSGTTAPKPSYFDQIYHEMSMWVQIVLKCSPPNKKREYIMPFMDILQVFTFADNLQISQTNLGFHRFTLPALTSQDMWLDLDCKKDAPDRWVLIHAIYFLRNKSGLNKNFVTDQNPLATLIKLKQQAGEMKLVKPSSEGVNEVDPVLSFKPEEVYLIPNLFEFYFAFPIATRGAIQKMTKVKDFPPTDKFFGASNISIDKQTSPEIAQLPETGFTWFATDLTEAARQKILLVSQTLAFNFLSFSSQVLRMPPFISKYLLNPEANATLSDLRHVYPQLAKQLEGALEKASEGQDMESYVCSMEEGARTNSSGIAVQLTENNQEEFEVAFCNYYLKQQWKQHLEVFAEGFWGRLENEGDNQLVSRDLSIEEVRAWAIEDFHEQVFGFYVSPEAFERALWFDEEVDQETRGWLQEFCKNRNSSQLGRILWFITGSKFNCDCIQVKMVKGPGTELRLPTSEVCSNTLLLPKYPSFREFQKKMSRSLMYSM